MAPTACCSRPPSIIFSIAALSVSRNQAKFLVSEAVDPDSIRRMGVDPHKSVGKFNCDQAEYLEYHHKHVFLKPEIKR